jgi:hypothetical protein
MVAVMFASLKRDCGYGCERGYGVWLRAWLRALSVGAGVAAGLVAGVRRIKRRNFIVVLFLSVPISYLPKYDIGTRKDKPPQKFPSLIRTTPVAISRINHALCNRDTSGTTDRTNNLLLLVPIKTAEF